MSLTVDLDSIWLLDITTRELSFLAEGEASVWSHDGQTLAVYLGTLAGGEPGRRQVRLVDLHGNILRTLPVGDAGSATEEYPSALSWSADGELIALSIATFDGPDRHRAYTVNVTTGEVRQFLLDHQVSQPLWSPLSDRIAYISFAPERMEGQLVIVDKDGNRLLTPPLPPEVSWITWSPDGTKIAFLFHGAIHILTLNRLSNDEPG